MKIPIILQLKITASSVLHVLKHPSYIALSLISTIMMGGLIIWSLNLELLRYIFFESPLTLWEKIDFYFAGYRGLFSTLDSMLSLGIIVFTVLFGINLALMVFVIKRQGLKAVPKKSGGGAFIFAVLGGGCVACGTSLLAPLLASLGAVSTPLIRDLGAILNWLGSILLIYSIIKLSLLVKTVIVANKDNLGEEA